MAYRVNTLVADVEAPPIAEVQGWIAGREFAPDRPLLDVAQAVPSDPPARELVDHLAQGLGDARVSRYTDILGLPELREALAAHMAADYGAAIDPAEVGITAGCNQAFCVALSALAGPGDEVILPLPYYFNHCMWLEQQGIRPVFLPFVPERAGIPDPEAARERVGPRTRAIVLVSPNNPTGAEYPAGVMQGFYRVARERELALVVDETYKDFRTGSGPAHGLFAEPGWQDTLVQLYSFSKVFSLAGYRVGSIVAGAALLAQAAKIMDCVAICAPHVGQRAALFGLRHLQAWRAARRAAIRERMARLAAALVTAGGGFRCVTSGAYFAYLRHPFRDRRAVEVARGLAEAAAILSVPGSMFGPGQEAYLRFAFANLESDRIPELAARLAAYGGTA